MFALLFVVASGLMADFLDDLYEAKWYKFRSLRKYSDILTVSVVSLLKVVEDLVHVAIWLMCPNDSDSWNTYRLYKLFVW